MNSDRMSDFFRYYDERASEYDQIYSAGGPAIPLPDAYARDVREIAAICSRYGSGHLADIGCGTGYWLAYYYRNCEEITLIDQSRNMLIACQARAAQFERETKVNYVKGDFFKIRFLKESFDSAVAAFFISHLDDEGMDVFFRKVMGSLRPGAAFLWIDGAWTEERAKYRAKDGTQLRKLEDGREFSIYKRYFTVDEACTILDAQKFDISSTYAGSVFFAVWACSRT